MLTIEPGWPRSRHDLAALCIMYHVPLRFVSITASHPFTVKSIAACGNWPPPLLISTSRRPKRSQVCAINSSTRSGSRIVIGHVAMARPSSRCTPAAVSSSFSALRPQIITSAPSLASRYVMARPSPLPPPETTNTCPRSRSSRNTLGSRASCSSVYPQRVCSSCFGAEFKVGLSTDGEAPGASDGGKAEQRDAGNVAIGNPTEVVRQAEGGRRQLSFAGAAEQLQIDFVGHAQSRRADRVAEALQSPVHL